MFTRKIQKTGKMDEREGQQQTFQDNLLVANKVSESLKNVSDYRLRILEELKQQLRNASVWKKI